MNVEDYAAHFGLRAERQTPRNGGAKYLITPPPGYNFGANLSRVQYADTAAEAKAAINLLASVHQRCQTCGAERQGPYGNVRST